MLRQIQERVRIARDISAGSLFHVWNSVMLTSLPLQRRLGRYFEVPCPVYVNLFGKTVRVLIGSGSDFSAFKEVFCERQYGAELNVDPRVILDLGGNVGFSAIYLAARFPNAVVHTVEPDPANFRRLQRNVASFPNIHAHQLAISDKNGTFTLYTNPQQGFSSSMVARDGFTKVDVPTQTLDDFLTSRKIDRVDLVKFDVEGAEFDVFRSSRALDRISVLIGEVHEDLMPVGAAEFSGLFRNFDLRESDLTPRRKLMIAVRKGESARP